MSRLKMTDEHYNFLRSRIEPHIEVLRRRKKEYEQKGLSDQRFVWDAYWLALPQPALGEWVRQTNYLNDAHIESALKKILKEVL